MKKEKKDYSTIYVTVSPKALQEGRPPNFLKIVDDFCDRFYAGDYTLKREAFSIPCVTEGVTLMGVPTRAEFNLGNLLSNALRNYSVAKSDDTDERKFHWADHCITWITHARAVGVIEEGESIKSKLDKCEQNIGQLREQYDKLKEECLNIKKENEELHRFLDRIDGSGVVEN